MLEPWLLAIVLMTVFLLALALCASSQPAVRTREERERGEILETLRRIEVILNRNASKSPNLSGEADPDASLQNPEDRHEEKD